MKLLRPLLFIALVLASGRTFGDTVHFSGGSMVIGKYLEIFEDPSGRLTDQQVLSQNNFTRSEGDVPNKSLTQSTFWIRFSVDNAAPSPLLYLELAHSFIHNAQLFRVDAGGTTLLRKFRQRDTFEVRDIKHQNLVFRLNIPKGSTVTYLMRVKGLNQVILPMIVRDQSSFFDASQLNETINGIFAGIIIVMVLYNMFIFFSVGDRSYLFYVLYVLCVGLAQMALSGYAFKYLWPMHPGFDAISSMWFSALAGIFAMFFVKNFLQLEEKWPAGVRITYVIMALYASAGLLSIAGLEMLSFRAVDASGGLGAVGLFVIGLRLSREGYRPARLFLLAWSLFLLGLFLMVLRNFNILPYNTLTTYTMQLGSILEIVLLSIALADKINALKKEKELSQEQALRISLENEKIIMEQNIVLERNVLERTTELRKANSELSVTLTKLKDTQTQLIDSEKMASLGQLTAGIAHEINNPINFVSSNIKPLRRDIDDVLEILSSYDELHSIASVDELQSKMKEIDRLKEDLDLEYVKTELGTLLKGMEDGAHRTVEIVKGLKIFSRLDEADLNVVNVNEGIESTLIILNYQIGNSIKLVKELGAIPSIECFAGKLNQVFMNILTNSIYALQKEKQDGKTPTIWVRSWLNDTDHVAISIRDNGPGMPPEVRAKIFEPFFTTKQVGDGTGLGLSIVFKIIDVHKGTIQVNTEVGQGTEFLITLPVKHQKQLSPVAYE
ncbi:sensor histidine kinase [Dyadobacter sandarakinus]|uniref:histidine kinase n=1 Tax=Dyadobacter sandarakinus TaxID=2747268 RepID=A0ABX7I4K3_9BACT|nr:7TM diverse intracellular signaling domain-containing protein [Dyadobacter sandarakinus]QRR01016.1 GHKL domain-containing protein [Dyadobacter sandarakinus]